MKKLSISAYMESSVHKEASELNILSVLVALSGGADSVAALKLLKKAGLKIMALHCNFHLRGMESDRDMAFVVDYCKSQNIPLKIKEFNVEEYLKAHKGLSLEMACRDLRYRWFDTVLKDTGADRIVTGHNADDNIETFFLNMFRGCGTRGLKGMVADNGTIWRPLLKYHRKEILSYLSEEKQNYVTDSTNLESDFRRNFLRNDIIPLLKEKWPGFEKALDNTISNISAENRLVEEIISYRLPKSKEAPLTSEIILKCPAPLLLIKRYIEEAAPYSTTANEILSAIKAAKPHIRRWQLKNGRVILRNGKLFIEVSHSESRP